MRKPNNACAKAPAYRLLRSLFCGQAIFLERKSQRGPAAPILLGCIAWVLVALMPPSLDALDLSWIAGTDNWTFNYTNPNWQPHAEPTSSDNASIENGGTAIVTLPGETCNILTVDPGTVQISSGSLTTSWEYVGYISTGVINHSGGSNSISNQLLVGYTYWTHWEYSKGTYNLSDAGQLYAPTEEIGVNTTGIFNQTGGINTISNNNLGLLLAANPGSVGTYNLTGGTLILGDLRKGDGTAAFNFGGGTIRANNSFSSTLPMTLTGINGNATIDTNNLAINLSGVLSGDGGLQKTGGGILTLGNANTFVGPVIFNGGLIQAANLNNLGNGTALNFNGGGLQFDGVFDPSVRTMTFQTNGASLDTKTNDIILANPVGNYGPGGLTKLGSGRLTLSASPNYSGPTIIVSGTLQLGAVASGVVLPAGRAVSLAGSTAILDTSGNSQTIGALTGVAGSEIKLGAGMLTTSFVGGDDNNPIVFAGTITKSFFVIMEQIGV